MASKEDNDESDWMDTVWKKAKLADDPEELKVYQTTWLLRASNRFHETFTYVLVKKMTWLYKAFKYSRYKRRKMALQFSWGFFLGIVFYMVILADLEMVWISAIIIGLGICLFLAIGNVVSKQLRCLTVLAIPIFGGHTGQTLLKAFIFAYLVAGPINNIVVNGQDAIRVLTCHTVLTYNMTKARVTHLFKPFYDAFIQMRANPGQLKGTLDALQEAVDPVRDEVEDESEEKKYKEDNDYMDQKQGESSRNAEIEKKYNVKSSDSKAVQRTKIYVKKLQYRCENIKNSATNKCYTKLGNLYQKCNLFLPKTAASFCLFVAPNLICSAFSLFGSDDMCNPSNIINNDFGASYELLQTAKANLQKEFENVKLNYKVIKPPSSVMEFAKSVYDAARQIVVEFLRSKSIAQIILLAVSRLMEFMFLKALIDCSRYLHNYLNDIEFDNTYVTMYFRKLDLRRKNAGKFYLLPLKQFELRYITDTYSFNMTESDKRYLRHTLLELLLEFIIVTIFVLIDFAIYEILSILRDYGYIQYIQVGHHDVILQIKGVGLIASLIRSVTSGFKVKKRLKKEYTNAACLPNPSHPSMYYLLKIYGSFLLLFLLGVLTSYVRRLYPTICGLFYPQADKQRSAYLYNEILRKRVSHLSYRLQIIKREHAKYGSLPDELGFFMVLRFKKPHWENWLLRLGSITMLNCARRRCVVCNELEPITGGRTVCRTLNCYLYYDEQCWDFVVIRRCIGCPGYKL